MDSNWKQAADARAVEAMTFEGEHEIRNRYEALGQCGEAEHEMPAPTMRRCNLPKGHDGKHSWQ